MTGKADLFTVILIREMEAATDEDDLRLRLKKVLSTEMAEVERDRFAATVAEARSPCCTAAIRCGRCGGDVRVTGDRALAARDRRLRAETLRVGAAIAFAKGEAARRVLVRGGIGDATRENLRACVEVCRELSEDIRAEADRIERSES